MLGRRGFAVESAAARVCREAGGRVTLNMMVRDELRDALGCSARPRHQTAGSCRKRFATVWWHTTGHRHDFGVHVALRWLSEAWGCSQGRCSSPNSQTQEGAHLSRADWTARSGQIGGSGWRGWAGLRRCDRSCASWPGPKHGLNRPSSEAGQSRLGGYGGLQPWRAALLGLSLLPY